MMSRLLIASPAAATMGARWRQLTLTYLGERLQNYNDGWQRLRSRRPSAIWPPIWPKGIRVVLLGGSNQTLAASGISDSRDFSSIAIGAAAAVEAEVAEGRCSCSVQPAVP